MELPPRRPPQWPAPPARRARQAAAGGLALAVLAAHWAVLQSAPRPSASPPAAAPLRVQWVSAAQVPAAATAPMQTTRPKAPDTPAPADALATPPPRADGRAAAPATRPLPTSAHSSAPSPDPPAELPPAHTPSAEPAAAAPAWPVYAARLPPPTTRHYLLRRGERSSPARLSWSHDAQGYGLVLMAEGGSLDGLGATSRGQIGPAGLVPERHVERRGGRDRRATNFDLANAQVRGSGGGEPQDWPPGGQDRLSWLLQLAAVLEADAALRRPGAQILLPVLGPRGPAAAWQFTVRGPETLTLADGRQMPALALQRAARHSYDLEVEVWLDPDDHHLPLQLRLAAPPGRWESLWLLQPAS